MNITGGDSNCKIHFSLQQFFEEWNRIKQRSADAGRFFVQFQTRKLIRLAALHTPIAGFGYKERGRARAGWWPAALAAGVSSVYTPVPNRGEGSASDNTSDPLNPSFTITNSVPYIGTMTRHGTQWFDAAVAQVAAEIRAYLERAWQRALTG